MKGDCTFMPRKDIWYLHLIQECQSADLQHRLDAWRDLGKEEEYLDRISAQYLLDRLNSTENWQEQSAILGLMCRVKGPLPIDSLMAILEDPDSSDAFLRLTLIQKFNVEDERSRNELRRRWYEYRNVEECGE